MKSIQPKSTPPENEPTEGSSGVFAKQADDLGIIGPATQMKEIRWRPGSAFATIITDEKTSDLIRLPIHAVYQAFGDGEAQLRKVVDLLLTGGGRRIEAVIPISNTRQSDSSVVVDASLDHTKEEQLIILNFFWQLDPTQVSPISQAVIPSGFLVVEAQTGAIVEANHEALVLLGVTDDESASVSWQRAPEWLQFVREVVEQGSVSNRVLEVLPDKTWLMFSAQYMQGKIYVVVQDASFIQQQIKSLEQSNAGLDNFVYHASHDLRAPLRSMQGLLTLLQKETSEAERNRFVGLIEASVNRLDAFLADLLSISRSRSSTPRPLLKINFMVEVEQAVSSFFHLEDHKNLEISTRVSQTRPFVSDLMQVRIILNNIISNAFKYRRYGVRKSRIKVEVKVSKKRVNIKISDNGIGMAAEHIPHVFEMFYRATDHNDGSGLGLYIVRETIDRLKGDISISSRPNRGTTFTVTLPNLYTATFPRSQAEEK